MQEAKKTPPPPPDPHTLNTHKPAPAPAPQPPPHRTATRATTQTSATSNQTLLTCRFRIWYGLLLRLHLLLIYDNSFDQYTAEDAENRIGHGLVSVLVAWLHAQISSYLLMSILC